MPHDADEAACAACGEVGWTRTLKEPRARYKAGQKLCRTCFDELVNGRVNPQTHFLKGGRIVTRHSEKER